MIAYTLRPAVREDSRKRWKILHEVWKTDYAHIYSPDEIESVFDNTAPQIASWVSRRRAELGYIVVEVEGQVVGFVGMASLYPDFSQFMERVGFPVEGEIIGLYLLAPYHGLGIGRALWNAGIQVLREYGCTMAWVWTIERAAAVTFYTHFGCTAAGAGTYTVGDHVERAVGFRIALTSAG
jgi:GNAT superfamily N-acetyltransferase